MPAFETDNDRAADNWEMLFRIAAVIDPDNVEAVVRVAVAKENSVMAERESERSTVMKAIRAVYLAVCEENKYNFDDPQLDFILSLKRPSAPS